MSIEALKWALRQKSRNSATQCVLLVLANAADPEGLALAWWKGRDHWWPYLMDKTRLSRGALFRILNELEDLGYFTRTQTKPQEGGRAQPVIQLHIEHDIMEPERVPEADSTAGNREVERVSILEGSDSTAETHSQSTTTTDEILPVTQGRLTDSTRETTRDVLVKTPESPQSPPLRKPIGLDEANGFGAFWSEYPDHQAMNRESALKAFSELTAVEQQQAVKTVAFYAKAIAKLHRRPVSPANWLKQKRFNEYGVGVQTSSAAGGIQLVKEGTEAWQAWCNVAAVRYGGGPKIPYHWGSQEHRGAWRPSQWPLGGEKWLVPLSDWIFVENGTAQYGRWCERIQEMLGGQPVTVCLANTRPSRVIHKGLIPIADRPIGQRDPRGLLVPLEWPPPKGASGAGPPKQPAKLATEDDLNEFAKTG